MSHFRFESIKIFVCGVLVLILGGIYFAFYFRNEDARLNEFKAELLSSIEQRKSCDGKIKATEVLPSQYTELCFQPAYINKLDFEKHTQKKIEGYEVLQHDGTGVWWGFEKNNTGRKLLISQAGSRGHPDIQTGLCFTKEDVSLFFDCNANLVYFKKEAK